MKLLPIDIDEDNNTIFRSNEYCIAVLDVYPGFYSRVGFDKPWIGYFVCTDEKEIVGSGGYKGKPVNGTVEIAYGTFQPHQGKGIGTEICRQLVLLAQATDPNVRITARTLQDGFASMGILKKNGFVCLGIVHDNDDGEVLEWEYNKPILKPQ